MSSRRATIRPAHIDGLPLGTRGGMKFRHNFPADGEYRFTIPDLGVDLYTRVVETRHTLVILIDGREVFRESLGGPEDMRTVDRGGAPGRAKVMKRFANIPVQVKAGTYDVAVTFIERARIESDEFVGFLPGDEFSRGDRDAAAGGRRHGVRAVQLAGRLGHAEPAAACSCAARKPAATSARARGASPRTSRAARSAGRSRPPRSIRCMPYFESGRKRRRIRRGHRAPGRRGAREPGVPVSRRFRSGARGARSTAFALTDLELASRLSFFLWSQGPDDALLKVAAAGRLATPAVLRAQALRMLRDPRARAWSATSRSRRSTSTSSSEVQPDPNLFPTFTEALRQDMATEAESFVASVLLEDRNVGDLLTADHTFLNERLARHYGITAVFGPQFRRVTLDDARRWGLLGKGAMLLRTSYGNRTSPVLRGAWVMGKLMGTPPTPPPPDVDTDLSKPKGEAPKTLRARLESHRSKPGCRQCHGVIDPIGLALENFDAIGRWRDVDTEAKAPIDASTVLPTGRRWTARPSSARRCSAAATCSCGRSPRS